MLFKWLCQLLDSIYRSIREEDIQWDEIVNKLNEEIILSIERYDQMEKRFDDTKFFMQCITYKKLIDIQKNDIKHSNVMCSINPEQNEKSTQTIQEQKMNVYNQSKLMDDLSIKLEQFHLN